MRSVSASRSPSATRPSASSSPRRSPAARSAAAPAQRLQPQGSSTSATASTAARAASSAVRTVTPSACPRSAPSIHDPNGSSGTVRTGCRGRGARRGARGRCPSCNVPDICSRAKDVPGRRSTTRSSPRKRSAHDVRAPAALPDDLPAALRFSTRPAAQGLYDPAQEHDACGVAFVADIAGRVTHETVEQGLTALRNLEHRGASGSEPETGDGAGILVQVPDAFLRAVLPRRAARGRPVRRRHRLPRRRRRAGPRRPYRHRGARPRGGPARPDLARPAGRPRGRRHRPHRPLGDAALRPARARRRRGRGADAVRPGAPRLRHAQARGARDRHLLQLAVDAHPGLQGDAHDRAAAAVLPRPVRRALRQRAGAGAQPLLDEHVPELAARAPVPLHRAQRRDQHRARQPQLDARPRGAAARPARAARRPEPAVPDLHARRLGLRVLRRGARAAAHGRPLAAARGADDGPGGVGERAGDGPGQARLLRVPLLAHGAVGRPGVRDLHRRHADRRGPGPQRAAARALVADGRRPRDPRQRGRRARRSGRPGRAPRAGSSRAGCSWWTPSRAASSRTTRSRRRWPPSTRTPTGCTAGRSTSTSSPSASTSSTATSPSRAASRSSATPRRSCASCSRRWPGRARSRSAPWAPTPRSPSCRRSRDCCSTTSASSSPR